MSRFLGLALLIGGLWGCSSGTILLGNPYPDGGAADAGPVPTVEVLSSPLDFGGVSVGGSAQRYLSLLNAGTVDAWVTFSQPPPPFSGPRPVSDAGTLSIHLVVGQLISEAGQTLGATFAPTSPGPAQSGLNYRVCLTVDGGACSPDQTIVLRGNGL